RLDRLGRSLRHLIEVIELLNERGVQLVSLTENIDTRSPSGKFMFHMIAALAEFERALIGERTRAGMVWVAGRCSKIGGPNALSPSQCEEARALLEFNSESCVARIFNVHSRTLRRSLHNFANKKKFED